MKGPARKPTALKILAGNPGRKKLNTAEPQPTPGIPDAPAHLNATAREEWDRAAVELLALGLLTLADRAALALYCQAWGRLVEAETELAKSGTIIKSPTGYPIQNPWLSVAVKASEACHRYGQQFGLTPVARSHLQVPDTKPAQIPSRLRYTGDAS